MSERKLKEIGRVTHYFTKIGVAVVELTDTLSVGDKILIQGSTTNFEQTVSSMQIEHRNVTKAYAGQSIGLKVENRVREMDRVYKIL
ncbi:MAG: translation elongation factor-like protein [Nitrososphaerota archaeon]|nr:translation elongation factor-like protein [Candidatus Bathyarchaeota archaeon]MDW8048866.1 translation elongation factor-like protein [Nitrososphaerota archaeon]